MPRPTWSHSSSWSLASSPFVRRNSGSRQRSKNFIPSPPSSQSPSAFTRTSGGRRARSKRFKPFLTYHSARQSCAELGSSPLLIVESIAHPSSVTASGTPSISPPGSSWSAPGPPGYAEPLLLLVESTALSTQCGFTLRAAAPVLVPCKVPLPVKAPAVSPIWSTLRSVAPVFVPRRSSLRPDAPIFVPSRFTLCVAAPVFVPHSSALRADAPLFVPCGSLSTLSAPFSLSYNDLFPPHTHPPPRPNSDPRVNRVPPDADTLPSIPSSLNRDAWEFFLQDYPDRIFVRSILHIIDHGENIGFTGNRLVSQTSRNLPSAFGHPDEISSAISTQLFRGRISGPFSEPPFPQFRSSPLGIAVRKRSGKLRQIHHLSWPRGCSVNDGINDSEAAISYDMFTWA